MPNVNQSSVIFFFLFAAFLVFITMRGELPVYLGFILGTPKQPAGSPATSPGGTGSETAAAKDSTGDFAKYADVAIKYAPLILA